MFLEIWRVNLADWKCKIGNVKLEIFWKCDFGNLNLIPQVNLNFKFSRKNSFFDNLKRDFHVVLFFSNFLKIQHLLTFGQHLLTIWCLKRHREKSTFWKMNFFEFSNLRISQLTSKKAIFASFWGKRLGDSANRISFS